MKKPIAFFLTTAACLSCLGFGVPALGEKAFPKDCEKHPKELQTKCDSDQNEQIYKLLQKILKETKEIKENQGSLPSSVQDTSSLAGFLEVALVAIAVLAWAREKRKEKAMKETAAILTQGRPNEIDDALGKIYKANKTLNTLSYEIYTLLKTQDPEILAQTWANYWTTYKKTPYDDLTLGQKAFLKIAARLFHRAIGDDRFSNGESQALENEREAQVLYDFLQDYLDEHDLKQAFLNLFKLTSRRKTAEALASEIIKPEKYDEALTIIFDLQLHPYENFLNKYEENKDHTEKPFVPYPREIIIDILDNVWGRKKNNDLKNHFLKTLDNALKTELDKLTAVEKGILRTLHKYCGSGDKGGFYGDEDQLKDLFHKLKPDTTFGIFSGFLPASLDLEERINNLKSPSILDQINVFFRAFLLGQGRGF